MDIEFSPRFLAQLSAAEASDPQLAEALHAVMERLHQAGDGSVSVGEFLAALERLGCELGPEEG